MKIQNEIHQIEELTMNALPALQTIFRNGWIIRRANGYTRRANSINPLYNIGEEYSAKTAFCEEFLRGENIEIAYKITSDKKMESFNRFLDKRGYRFDGLVSVQTVNLTNITLDYEGRAKLVTSDKLTDEWLHSMCAFNNISDVNRETLAEMLCLIIPKVQYFTLVNDAEVIACGMCVLERGYLGLYDIVTNETYRGKGYGKQLVSEVINWGITHHAQKAYLQVTMNNNPAIKFYEKFGFKELYTYWYRIKRFD